MSTKLEADILVSAAIFVVIGAGCCAILAENILLLGASMIALIHERCIVYPAWRDME